MTNPKISQISWADFWHSKRRDAPGCSMFPSFEDGKLASSDGYSCAWRFMVMLSFTGERVIWQFASIMLSETIPQLKKDSQYCFSASILFSRSIDSWDFLSLYFRFQESTPKHHLLPISLTDNIRLRSPSAPIWFRFLHCLRGWCSWCNLMKRHGDNNHRH